MAINKKAISGAEYITRFHEVVEIFNEIATAYTTNVREILLNHRKTNRDEARHLHSESQKIKTIIESIHIRINASKHKNPKTEEKTLQDLDEYYQNIIQKGLMIDPEMLTQYSIALNKYLIDTEMEDLFQQSRRILEGSEGSEWKM